MHDPTGFESVPSHYADDAGREVIDVIREHLTKEEFIGSCVGNRMK
jgi:hypothetical protein